MRAARIFLLLVAVAVLGYEIHSQNAAMADQQRQITELHTKLEAKLQTASLELQEKCSKQARNEFEASWKKEPWAMFMNHYNEKMNKCFILIQNTTPQRDGTFLTHKSLYDVFEGKSYGECVWLSDKAKDYWEVAPSICSGTLLSGEKRFCHSLDEFDEIVKLYMQ